MDEMKKRTVKNYTAWDLNCSCYGYTHDRKKLKPIFKRAARHQMKQELKKGLTFSA